jgi:hypothetical protein
MRHATWSLAASALLVAGAAHAQTAVPASAENPSAAWSQPASGPGIDVSQTLNPKPPTSNPTQTTPPLWSDPYVPRGFNAGSVTLYPSITAGAFYDDNVFALPTNRRADWAFFARPEIALRSNNWSNVELTASAFLEARQYRTYDSEDQVNGGAAIGATVQLGRDAQIVGRAQYLHGHESRGVSDTITNQFDRPVAFDQFEAAAALNNRWGRVWTSVGASGLVVRYDDPTIAGFTVPQTYRNGEIARVPVRLGYVVAPLTSVFVEGSYNRRDFEVDMFDSDGYRAVAGLLFEPGPGARVRGELFAGYMRQTYEGASLQTVSTWTAGGSLAWIAAPGLTATLEGRRDAREASLSGGVLPGDGVSVVESVIALRADYRILPNVVVGAGISYTDDEFLGAGRTDQAWSPLASVKYFVNPMLTVGFDYRRVNFDSSTFFVPSYFRDVYMLTANAKF